MTDFYLLEASTKKLVSNSSQPAMKPTVTIIIRVMACVLTPSSPPRNTMVKHRRNVPIAMVPVLFET